MLLLQHPTYCILPVPWQKWEKKIRPQPLASSQTSFECLEAGSQNSKVSAVNLCLLHTPVLPLGLQLFYPLNPLYCCGLRAVTVHLLIYAMIPVATWEKKKKSVNRHSRKGETIQNAQGIPQNEPFAWSLLRDLRKTTATHGLFFTLFMRMRWGEKRDVKSGEWFPPTYSYCMCRGGGRCLWALSSLLIKILKL